MTFMGGALVVAIIAAVGFWAADFRKSHRADWARKRKEYLLICKYNTVVYFLVESGYGVEYEFAADGTAVIVRQDGTIVKINPFSALDYSREQLTSIAEWLEEKMPAAWARTDTEHNRSARGRSEMSMRVRACVDEYCKEVEDW